MKPDEIQIGRTYFDGKQGLRRVTDAGPHCNRYDAPPGTECVAYEVLAERAVRSNDPHASTRTSFATWAKAIIPVGEEDRAQAVLQARTLTRGLSEAQRAVLLRLRKDQAGRPHAQPLSRGEQAAARSLQAKALVLMPAPSYARLAPLGELVADHLAGEALVVPIEAAPSGPRPRRPRLG
jgi:hypothetical protein